MEENTGIEVNHVYKSFGKEQVLMDVNFSIPPGSIYGVVGNNGSGKTVLMKCICGFMKCDRGKIVVNGRQVGKEVDFPDRLGVIIETPGFIPNLTGYKNLKILAALKGRIGKSEIRGTLQRVGLDPDMKKPVSKYSLGMRQRLGIAQAIMEDPKVLVLDEPFNGLDRYGVVEIRALLKDLKADGKSILLASHNAQDIEELCDHVKDLMLERNEINE
ncbi:MAG: ATP-binding cassette domain-containing protein [Eubacterium sp.]|nr:ATP-binding cassette domain-containing protein [Eubacterium sp.]MCI9411766.1 ATP-binding cassette domain-containing protein [Eubacterium sp.]